MGAVRSVRFIALSARLSTIDDTVVDGPSEVETICRSRGWG